MLHRPQGDGRRAKKIGLLGCFTALLGLAAATAAAATATNPSSGHQLPVDVAYVSSTPDTGAAKVIGDAAGLASQSDNALEQFCIKDGLTRHIQLRRPVMQNPGSRHGRYQTVKVWGKFAEFAEQCQDKYSSAYQSQVQIKRRVGKPGKKVAKWLTMNSGYGWGMIFSRDTAGWGLYQEQPGGHDDPPWYFNRGGRFPVRVKTRAKIVKDELVRTPVKGHPGLFNEFRPTIAQKIVSITRAKVPRRRIWR